MIRHAMVPLPGLQPSGRRGPQGRLGIPERSGTITALMAGALVAGLFGISSARAADRTAAGLAAPAPLPALPAPAVTSGAQPAATAAVANRRIVLELGKRTISLLEGNQVVGSWPVAVGDPATPTPTGTYAILNKVVNPQYQSTKSGKNNPTIGPNGPLGDRWMGFHTSANNQYGIHGTPPAWEWTVKSRAAVSHGCVRMLTPNVRFLFDRVEIGTPVIVRP